MQLETLKAKQWSNIIKKKIYIYSCDDVTSIKAKEYKLKEIGIGSSLNPLYLTKTLVIYSFIIGLIVVKKFVFIALLDKQWFISK